MCFGLPRFRFPAGFSKRGLPIGLMIAGPRFSPKEKFWHSHARTNKPRVAQTQTAVDGGVGAAAGGERMKKEVVRREVVRLLVVRG